MYQIEYTKLTPTLVANMRTKSKPGAPWAHAPDTFWEFLLNSIALDIPWSIESALEKEWIVHAKTLSKTAQERLAWDLQNLRRPGFEYGIGIEERTYMGGMTGTGYTGEGENRYSPSCEQDPQFVELGKLMTIFWPDLPFLAWEQIKPLVSERSQESENEFHGGTSDYEVDRLDAAKVFRVLNFAGRLTPTTQRVQDWKAIVSPPPVSTASSQHKRKT